MPSSAPSETTRALQMAREPGNRRSRERLDFTVIGPAVNEASRIAAMCRSVDQPVLMSSAFADVKDIKRRLVSVGRYALRGVAHPQELFTLDPDA